MWTPIRACACRRPSPAIAAVFGADVVPGCYADLDEADLIVLVGSNAAWCHPVLYQRMMAARRRRGTKIVVVDPRRTATAEDADLVLTIAPGMDTALFSGLLVHLADTGAIDRTYIDTYTGGFDEALGRARAIAPDIAATAAVAGLSASDVAHFFDLFATTGAHRHGVFARRQPVGPGHRQGSRPSSTAISPPAASAGPAWGRSR